MARPGLLAAVLTAAVLVAVPPAAAQATVQAPGPLGPLAGTMLVPARDDAPIVLIIPGSGLTDRDGNGPGGLNASTYRLLAEGLAQRGIATVRIDKRGLHGSQAAVADPNAVTIKDYAADVHAWIAAIRHGRSAPCIWVLGHSEGGLVALAAAQEPRGICGLMLVATAGRPLGAVLRDQLRGNPANAPILDQALAATAALEAGQHVDVQTLNPALRPLFRPAVQGFLIDEFSYDPAGLIASIHLPILIVQGNRDIQVGTGDAERLSRAQPAATLAILSDTNHVLKTVMSPSRTDNAATYGDPGLPLAPGVIDALAVFIETAGR